MRYEIIVMVRLNDFREVNNTSALLSEVQRKNFTSSISGIINLNGHEVKSELPQGGFIGFIEAGSVEEARVEAHRTFSEALSSASLSGEVFTFIRDGHTAELDICVNNVTL
jgi:hypothetical protein